MRLLLVGAFPYPHHQGSQIYFQEQANALRDAGAEVELLTYASGLPDAAAGRALDGFVHHTPPAWTAPRGLGSELSLGKPLADLALAMTLRQTVASKSASKSYDAILTHNAESCLASLLGLARVSIPVVYCVHSLLGEELSASVSYWKKSSFSSSSKRPPSRRRILDSIGRRIDRLLARRVDGWIALTHSSQRVMRQSSTGPGERIPPPVPDPRSNPDRLDAYETARHYSLDPGGYFLYSGNLDGYQELEILEAAAQLLAQAIGDPQRHPMLVVASHDPDGEKRIDPMPGVEFRFVSEISEMQALVAAASANLLMRQAEGGYPIKLANAHAAGTPSITFHGREWGLHDGQDALVASRDRPAATLAGCVLKLAGDADLVTQLGAGARRLYEAQHRPEQAAMRTLSLIEKVVSAPGLPPTTSS